MRSYPWIAAGLAWTILAGPIGAQELPKASNELLPTPPAAAETKHSWLITDLAQVPEILLQKVEPLRDPVLAKDINLLTQEERELLDRLREEVSQRTTQSVGKINKANETATDHFMKVLVQSRGDLVGLPWVMGDACRTSKDRSVALVREVLTVRAALRVGKGDVVPVESANKIEKLPWERYDSLIESVNAKAKLPALKSNEELPPARIAALMQILGPASANVREEMVKRIARVKDVDATRALARLAVFSAEAEVRNAAIDALTVRKKEDYTPILMQALRYPWPTVAKNASAALVALASNEQVPALVALLDEPDPRAPVTKGRKTPAVREVVKVNHHRNCLLCHAPVKAEEGLSPSAVVLAEIPSEAQPLPSQASGYKSSKKFSPQLAVRVDVTYLRQDFSLLQPVANAAPWPEMQRFDYLVREREVGAKDVEAYQTWLAEQPQGYVSPHHRAALAALRELTGRDAGPTAPAWREVLGL